MKQHSPYLKLSDEEWRSGFLIGVQSFLNNISPQPLGSKARRECFLSMCGVQEVDSSN